MRVWLGLLALCAMGCGVAEHELGEGEAVDDIGFEMDATGPEMLPPPGASLIAPANICPGANGTFTTTGVGVGAPVTYVYSFAGLGVGPCHPGLGLCLGLLPPVQIAGQEFGDGFGYTSLDVAVPFGAPQVVYVQAVETGATPALTNATTTTLVAMGNDFDGDGITGACGDCDDSDASIYPGAPDPPGGIDQDCDGVP